MGKNIMIATLLIFFTLTQAAPPPTTKGRITSSLMSIHKELRRMQEKMPLVEQCMTDTSIDGKSYRSRTKGDLVRIQSIQNRFDTIQNPTKWSGYTYTELLASPNTDNGWLPVCLAFEYLIIARALYDMKRFHYYTKYQVSLQLDNPEEKAPNQLPQYRNFVSEHVNMKLALRSIGATEKDSTAKLTKYVDMLLVDQGLSVGTDVKSALDLLGRVGTGGMSQSTNHGDGPELDLIGRVGRDGTSNPMITSTDSVDKTELDLIGRVGKTSDPMVTSTDDVDWQTQELLGQHRVDDSDAPPSVMFDFFRQAGKQASGFSHGTHYTEEYQAHTYFEQQSVPQPFIPHHAAESSTHGHDNRNRGKMPMHDDSSAPSCYPYYPYHSPDGEHRRR
ncbi:hypothetical protein SeLEV6574_g08478 [Synchytrium endobioticum]|uniref:ENTH domain-containing protein n=1 Tax=Synchytrium endobioticum TaxID=286115 RepID=A0A507BR10_9FUNG|nr:hypothetical protein SeLEV6574_g08478 [Synchytrium endobioticum]